MAALAAGRTRREAALTDRFHGRVETWLNSSAAAVDAGERPPSPSYQTKNHAAHHRFRERDPSKELGTMRMSASGHSATARGSGHYTTERNRKKPLADPLPPLFRG